MNYFIRIQGKTFGPLGINDMMQLKQRGKLKPFHEVSTDQSEWLPADNFEELFPVTTRPITTTGATNGGGGYGVTVVTDPPPTTAPSGSIIKPQSSESYKDLYMASILIGIATILHFISNQLQYFTLANSITEVGAAILNNNRFKTSDNTILIVITVLTLLILFTLLILGSAFLIRAGKAFQSKGLGIASLILFILSMVLIFASFIVIFTGKSPETMKIGSILALLGTIIYYSSFSLNTFYYQNAFHELGRRGQSYSCGILGFAWIGFVFTLSLSSFILTLLILNNKPDLETSVNIIPIITTISLESLIGLQIVFVWFLYQTFALRFYLGENLKGN